MNDFLWDDLVPETQWENFSDCILLLKRKEEGTLHVLEHLPPKLMSAYFLLCALTYTSYLTRWCPPLPLSKKRVNLQLQLIIPWNDNVPTYKLFWKSFSLPVWVFRAHVIGQSLPIVRGRRCSKLSKHRFLSVVKWLIRNCIGEGFFTCWANFCC